MEHGAGMVWLSKGDGCAGGTWREYPEIGAAWIGNQKQGATLQLVPGQVCCGMGTGMHRQAGPEGYLFRLCPFPSSPVSSCDAQGAAPLCLFKCSQLCPKALSLRQ